MSIGQNLGAIIDRRAIGYISPAVLLNARGRREADLFLAVKSFFLG
jgi:hypothetical protein